MKRTITLENIGKYENKAFDLSEGQMFAFIGQNKSGKSTIIRALETIFGVKGFMKKPVTSGKDKGLIQYKGEDIDGNPITIIWEVKDGETAGKFKATTSEDGKIKTISNINKIRELMGVYMPLTAQDALNMMKFAETRRTFINDYILPCIQPDKLEELKEIDTKISNSSRKECQNNLFHQRTEAKKEYETESKLIETLKVINDGGEEVSLKAVEAGLKKLNGMLDGKRKEKTELNNNYHSMKEISDLSAKLLASLEKHDAYKDETVHVKAISENSETLFLELEKGYSSIDEEIDALIVRVERGNSTKEKIEQYQEVLKQKRLLFDEVQELTEEIERLRGKKLKIISSSSLPKGLKIEDDEITFHDLPFDTTVVSETEAQIAMIELMLQITDSPLINIGDWSLYDENSKQEIYSIVEDMNCILIGQLVTDDEEVDCEIIINE